MKGTLHKIEDGGWYVSELSLKKHYAGFSTQNYYPLHPHDARQYQEEYDYYGATGFKPTEVDFEIVDGYAQLITILPEEEKYPELEGTVALTDELILKREVFNWLSTRFTEDAPLNYVIREYRKKFLNERNIT